jgi:predicted aspartyl protease
MLKFPYKEEDSKIFGKIKRPRIDFDVYSEEKKEWIAIGEVLVDTGADLTVLPRNIGELVVEDITVGQYVEIKGVVPSAVLIAFIHRLKIKIDSYEFRQRVAIADSNNVPTIFGRVDGLDRFKAYFNGNDLVLEWKG